ncbi:substrate-binding protein-like domain-containing protein [Sphingobium faniae]|nr:substrate-binding protein-like domain-containing protein [Sphingobium faniae]
MLAGGGTRFAYAGADSIASRARRDGFCAALAEAGLAPPRCLIGTLDHDGGYAIGRELLVSSERPDAIFCVNDLTAIGIVEAFRIEGGLNCPDDFQIIGFDDIPAARWPSYDLTTFNQNVDEMASRAAEFLEAGAIRFRPATKVDFTLVERKSTNRA